MADKPKMEKYDLSILRLIHTITTMTVENRNLLLKEMESFAKKIKLRATRKKCHIPIEFINSRESHTAIVENISFTGAYISCRVPLMIDEKIIMYFQLENSAEKLKLSAKVVHTKLRGFGVRFEKLDSRAARFLQALMNQNG
jgi:Tfp pilus assembly protein PilZ